jgi:hypothetical protein
MFYEPDRHESGCLGGTNPKTSLAASRNSWEQLVARAPTWNAWLLGVIPQKTGKGVVFLTPVKGDSVRKAAKAEGLAPAEKLATLKVEGDDSQIANSRPSASTPNVAANIKGRVLTLDILT